MTEKILNLSRLQLSIIVAAVSALLFIPFIGNLHLFDWDEINFAECAREMIETGNYMRVYIDYEPFWEKPPLFFWLQVISMKIFGINEFAARFPNAVIGMIAMVALFNIGTTLKDKKFGLIWVLSYAGSILPFFYFKSGIIDPLFNLFMFLAVYFLYKTISSGNRYYIFAGIATGLAVMVKGPVGYLLPSLTYGIIWLLKRKDKVLSIKGFFIYTLFTILTASVWFGIELIMNGTWFINEFIRYQIRLLTTGDAGHSQPIYYHFLVVFFGCFPASIFIFKSMRIKWEEDQDSKMLRFFMLVLFGVVMVVFSLVKTKIVHYSSLAYYPLSFLAAYTVYSILSGKTELKKRNYIVYGIAALVPFILLILVPVLGIWKETFMPYINDKFVRANLEAPVIWGGYEFVPGLIYAALIIFALVLIIKGRVLRGYVVSATSTAVILFIFLPLVVPKVEGYTQRTPISFYESKIGKDEYVKVVGFRSYADLFYTRKPKHLSASGVGVEHKYWEDYLLNEKLDKPAYFVTKFDEEYINIRGEKKKWVEHPNLEVVEIKAGFAFLKRKNPETKLPGDNRREYKD
ncbi:MAG: glycosyltransferase family 39 protein [Ignavibacteriaceae bacterium]|nr:glycosyltransferase family 39 protein [Ignavibacteriaceae bacterium]